MLWAMHRRLVTALVAAGIAYDTLVRPWMQDWGATASERTETLPGDDVVQEVMSHHTRAITIEAPPEGVWPWLVQIGDRRAGFYSHDWVERFVFPGMVHYIERTHSANRIHVELQRVRIGDRINTGSIGKFEIGAPITVLEPNRAFVIGTWAFVLRPLPGGRTRLLVRERDSGWLRAAAGRRSGIIRAAGGFVDYVVGEPLHFVMVTGMMRGLKQRAESLEPSSNTEPPD